MGVPSAPGAVLERTADATCANACHSIAPGFVECYVDTGYGSQDMNCWTTESTAGFPVECHFDNNACS
jgi:hypothetical protein